MLVNVPVGSSPTPQVSTSANQPTERPSFRLPKPNPYVFYGNRILALATSPRRLWNFIKYHRAKRSEVLNFLPIHLDIEPLSRCNFHCTMCQVSDWKKYQRGADLTFEDFKSLVDSQYGLLEIKLQGLGEPLLARDTFFKMIRYARKRFIWVRTTINASLLHLNDNYKKLIDSGINEVQISFDGATKETFEKIRRGSNFEKVVENCKLVNRYCNERGLLRTRMWSLIQAHNVHELRDFLPLAKEMGFKRMTFSLAVHGWGTDRWTEINQDANRQESVSAEIIQEVEQRGRELGIDVTFWRATVKYNTDDIANLCQWPFERAFVSSDMRIVPCCTISNPDVIELGSAKSFTDVWNGETYREFRRAHLRGEIPKACQQCYAQQKSKLPILNS